MLELIDRSNSQLGQFPKFSPSKEESTSVEPSIISDCLSNENDDFYLLIMLNQNENIIQCKGG